MRHRRFTNLSARAAGNEFPKESSTKSFHVISFYINDATEAVIVSFGVKVNVEVKVAATEITFK